MLKLLMAKALPSRSTNAGHPGPAGKPVQSQHEKGENCRPQKEWQEESARQHLLCQAALAACGHAAIRRENEALLHRHGTVLRAAAIECASASSCIGWFQTQECKQCCASSGTACDAMVAAVLPMKDFWTGPAAHYWRPTAPTFLWLASRPLLCLCNGA